MYLLWYHRSKDTPEERAEGEQPMFPETFGADFANCRVIYISCREKLERADKQEEGTRIHSPVD